MDSQAKKPEITPAPEKKRKLRVKTLLQVLVGVLAVAYVVVSFSQIKSIGEALSHGNWIFLVLAFVVMAACLVDNALTYRSIYRLMGTDESLRTLLKVSTAYFFVNAIAPSGGFSGMAFFVAYAKRKDVTTARIMVIGILYVIYEYATLLSVVMVGFVALLRRHDLTAGEVTAALLLLLMAVGFVVLLYLANRSSARLGRLLAGIFRWINRVLFRFFHRDVLKPENAENFAFEMGEGITAIRSSRKNLLMPFVFSLINKGLLITVLAFVFLALGVRFSTGSLVGAFSIGQLFYYVSPTPGGVGVVESVLPVALNLLRVPFTKAMLVTLIYRAVTYWFPFVVGGVSLRLLQKSRKE